MRDFIPVHVETQFRRGSDRQNVTNSHGPVFVHAIRLAGRVPVLALVEYDRYNGSDSPLGLWTRVLEVVPISELWEVAAKAERPSIPTRLRRLVASMVAKPPI